jgi:prevent-host-death family protein
MVTNMVMKSRASRAADSPTISAAEFKAKCLELMAVVERTGRSIIITKRGRPVAVLAPVRRATVSAYGFMKDQIEIVGDIVAPVGERWNADK